VKEAIAIVKTVVIANEARSVNEAIIVADKARSGDKDIDANVKGGFIIVVAENHFNNALITLVISLLAQDTS
jgi:hypothetical protein